MTHFGSPEIGDYGDQEFADPCACDSEFTEECPHHCLFCRVEYSFMNRATKYVEPDTGLIITICQRCKGEAE